MNILYDRNYCLLLSQYEKLKLKNEKDFLEKD
jgi:hypothetical protein